MRRSRAVRADRAGRLFALFAVLTSVIGCRGCFCSNLWSTMTDAPPSPLVRERVEQELRHAAAVAAELCGVPAEGLEEVTVEVRSQTLGTSTVHVEGKPVLAEAAGADAGKLEVGKALVCLGVLTVIFVPLVDGDGKSTGWKLSSMEVSGIETEGVHFEEAKHHHHHHH